MQYARGLYVLADKHCFRLQPQLRAPSSTDHKPPSGLEETKNSDMFHVDSTKGRLEFYQKLPGMERGIKPVQQQTSKLKCPLCSGRILFFNAVIFFTFVFVTVIEYAEVCRGHRPAYLEVALPPVKLNDTLLRLRLKDVVDTVKLAGLPALPTVPPEKRHLFKFELSDKDMEVMTDLLNIFNKTMVDASIAYFLYKGSLLGSYRHHSIIPWDDDLDFLVSFENKKKMSGAFKKLLPDYILENSTSRYKFFARDGHAIRKLKWKSPFLDVSFYNENTTHLWDVTIPKQSPFSRSDIFPLTYRPLLGGLFPSPRDPLRTLQVTYKLDDCYTGAYNHTGEVRRRNSSVGTVPCSALIDSVAFVHHVRGPGGAWCEEVLTFRGEILNTYVRDATDIPVC